MSNGDSHQNYNDIDFAFYPAISGTLYIYEGGTPRGTFGTYATSDVLRVAVEGGVVKYRKNGALLYTSTVSPTYPLLVDTSLYSNGATLNNVVISGAAGGGGGSSTQIRWLVTDHLGTPRMIFDQSGLLANVSRHDYLPFGEELFAGTGGRTTALGYTASDGVRQKFTQKERDNETGLDYFLARYYSSTQGRFTSPDPLMASANPSLPAAWNRYTYTLNNPLRYIDPTGEKPQDPSPGRAKEREFALRHPKIAIQVGRVESGATNISTNSTRFSTRIGLHENTSREGSQVNAYRHVVWSATITSRFGAGIAGEVGRAHESLNPDRRSAYFGPNASALADARADGLNNAIGQQVAGDNTGASPRDLALKALDQFHQVGFFTTQQNQNGSVSVVLTRITDEQYNHARGVLMGLNDNGFTQSEQQQHDAAAARQHELERSRRPKGDDE